jgi:hypothetical protein
MKHAQDEKTSSVYEVENDLTLVVSPADQIDLEKLATTPSQHYRMDKLETIPTSKCYNHQAPKFSLWVHRYGCCQYLGPCQH